MSETAADREYFAAAEAAFIQRRGTPFLLSSKDFGLLKEWRSLGVPLEAITQGIDDAFSRREQRSATARINSLEYCRQAVLEAWERRAEMAVGKGAGTSAAQTPIGPTLAALQEKLSALAARWPPLADAVDSAKASLTRLASSGKSASEIEGSLARIDKALAKSLLEALPEEDRSAIALESASRIVAARGKMDDAAAERTLHALERRMLRERLDLPRLTLLP